MTQTENTPSPDLSYVPIITRELLTRMLKHVAIWYWPVLFLNLLRVKRWANQVDYQGDGYIAVRFSRFGEVQLKWGGQVFLEDGPQVDVSPLDALPSWQALQTRILTMFRAPSARWDLWRLGLSSHMIPVALGSSFRWRCGAWGWCGKKLEPG